MQLNKGLNLDTHPSNVETGDFRYAQNISLDNTKQYPINEKGLQSLGIDVVNLAGTIPYDKGIVLFANTNYIYVVDTSTNPETLKQTLKVDLTFLPEKPIRGTYTYNQNGDLIICFSSGVDGNFEDKIINLNSYGSNHILTPKENKRLNINPDVVFPEVTSEIINGNLMTGSYQISVSYYIDKEYTNHSLLSLPVYIYGNNTTFGEGGNEGLAPNQISTKGIKYKFVNIDDNFSHYRISVIYNNGTNFIVYTTPNINTSVNEYIIDDIFKLDKGNLDDTLINSIFYSNSESLSVMNNRLYRANLKGQNIQTFDNVAVKLANKVKLELKEQEINKTTISVDKQYIKFQNDEVYALYLTLGDKKGNIIGSYPITSNDSNINTIKDYTVIPNNPILTFTSTSVTITYPYTVSKNVTISVMALLGNSPGSPSADITVLKDTSTTTVNINFIYGDRYVITNISDTVTHSIPINPEDNRYYTIPKENSGADGDLVRYTTNHIEVTLPNFADVLTPEEILETNKIGFWCIHRAQRNNTNSKIYTQGISCADTIEYYNYILYPYAKPLALAVLTPLSGSVASTNKYGWERELPNFEKNNYIEGLSSIRFYSFEDIFNKSEIFPITKYDCISEYSLASHSGYDIDYQQIYNNEKIKNKTNTLTNQKLLEGNNLSNLTVGSEAIRKLTLSKISNNYDDLYLTLPLSTTTSSEALIKRNKYHRLNIFNYNENNEYYKHVYNEVLVLCSTVKYFDNTLLTNNSINIQGDTYYSKFKVIIKNLILPYFSFHFGSAQALENAADAYDNSAQTMIREYTAFVESKYNIHARYWEGDYPDWEQPINTATQTGYNKVYNLQNTQNAVTIVDVNNNDERNLDKGLYPSRIVMSKTKSQESNVLNFRKYLALDYYDMPYNRNAIVALNSTYKNLYIQQELALSVASVKDIISYQDGSTYVGSGQLFDRIPTEVIPTGYGFLGCESYFNTGITDIGLWVIDAVQSLMALITDDNIKIISNGKNQNYFNGKLKGKNPYINQGSFITYDNSDKENKRLLLVNHLNNICLSYYPILENWFSFHTYIPKVGVYTRNDTYYLFERTIDYVVKNRLFKYSNNIKSKFSDIPTVQESIISLYFNEDKGMTKLFESIYWQSKFIIDNIDIYDKTFTELFIHNDSQSTKRVLIGDNKEWFDSDNGVFKNNTWIFNHLFDYVKDNRKPFLGDFINFVNTNMVDTKDWFDISKIMSIFACVTMIFDNYYYSADGNTKSQFATLTEPKQPTLLLNNLEITYKPSNR